MAKIKSEVGNTYGQWTVLRRAPPEGNVTHARWLCRCTCGAEVSVIGDHLRRGRSRSCGCEPRKRSTQTLINVNEQRRLGLKPHSKKRAA